MSESTKKSVLIGDAGRRVGREIELAFGADVAQVCVSYAHPATMAEPTAMFDRRRNRR